MKDYFQIIHDIGFSDMGYVEPNKYGLFNVNIMKSDDNILGMYWYYKYFDKEKSTLRIISSVDLVELRKKVENKGLEWVVLNAEKAKQMYDINREMQKIRKARLQDSYEKRAANMRAKRGKVGKPNKTGIKYVYIKHNKGKTYWMYNERVNLGNGEYKFIQFSCRTLRGLEKKAKERDVELLIIDEEKYQKSLGMDKVEE